MTQESHCWKSTPATGIPKDVSTRIFIATQCIIAKDWEQGKSFLVETVVSKHNGGQVVKEKKENLNRLLQARSQNEDVP